MALGPFRRFTGGDPALKGNEGTVVSPFITLFQEGSTLAGTLDWINGYYQKRLEKDAQAEKIIRGIEALLSSADLLPLGLKFKSIYSGGIQFLNNENQKIQLEELSDGMKSVLSLVLEILRQALFVYDPEVIFSFQKTGMLPDKIGPILVVGLVMIDEIDAHLHPSWQTRIGQWLRKIFPNIQFIVTAHSPLVCRAAEKGSIWRLMPPGSLTSSAELKGQDRDKLIYGNVLDAFDTEIFGDKISRGNEGKKLQEEYRELVYKERFGEKMTKEEVKELEHLKTIFHIHVEAKKP